MVDRDWDRLFGHGEPEHERVVELGGAHPAYLLDGPADLFAVRVRPDGARSRRHFVARLPAHGLVPSTPLAGPWRLILVPAGRHRRAAPHRRTAGPRGTLGRRPGDGPGRPRAGRRRRPHPARPRRRRTGGQSPRGARTLQPGKPATLTEGDALTSNTDVRWVRPSGGDLVHNGGTAGTIGDGELAPLAGRDWVVAAGPCRVTSVSTWQLLAAGELRPVLDAHVHRLLGVIDVRVDRLAERFVGGIGERKRVNTAALRGAARSALRVVGGGARVPDDEHEYHFARYRRAADVLEIVTADGVAVVEPADHRHPPADDQEALQAVARSSALHLRPVKLPAGWWRHDLGPLIGWRGGAAVALRFQGGRYHEIEPQARTATPLTSAGATAFETTAAQVQAPLPRRAGMRDALRLGLSGGRRDLLALLIVGLVVASLGLATPLVVGRVLASISDTGSTGGMLALAGLLVSAAVVAGLVGVAQGLRLLRLEGRAEIGTQLVLWDRLMRLPVRFFRSTSSGELANSVLGISFIRQALSGLLAQAVSAILTIVADLTLIFWISAPLGFACLGVTAVAGLLVWVFGGLIVRRQRRRCRPSTGPRR
ncbi:ABC transporter transmembrane domain-containing protein [Luedemannella flava]